MVDSSFIPMVSISSPRDQNQTGDVMDILAQCDKFDPSKQIQMTRELDRVWTSDMVNGRGRNSR
jgi:hypothetical protein